MFICNEFTKLWIYVKIIDLLSTCSWSLLKKREKGTVDVSQIMWQDRHLPPTITGRFYGWTFGQDTKLVTTLPKSGVERDEGSYREGMFSVVHPLPPGLSPPCVYSHDLSILIGQWYPSDKGGKWPWPRFRWVDSRVSELNLCQTGR